MHHSIPAIRNGAQPVNRFRLRLAAAIAVLLLKKRYKDKARPNGVHRGLGPIRDVQLLQDVLHVRLDGRRTEGSSSCGDLLVRKAISHQFQHLQLSGRQRYLDVGRGS